MNQINLITSQKNPLKCTRAKSIKQSLDKSNSKKKSSEDILCLGMDATQNGKTLLLSQLIPITLIHIRTKQLLPLDKSGFLNIWITRSSPAIPIR